MPMRCHLQPRPCPENLFLSSLYVISGSSIGSAQAVHPASETPPRSHRAPSARRFVPLDMLYSTQMLPTVPGSDDP